MPNASLRRRLLAGLVFGFLVLLGLALLGDLRQVGGRVLAFRWSLFPLILLLTLFNYLLRWFKFHYYLAQIGAEKIKPGDSLRLFVAGFPLAVTPGKVGEALKGVWIHQASGAPVARGVAVVAAERISDGLAVLGLSTLGVIAYPRYWPAFVLGLAVLLSIVVISQIRPLAEALLNLAQRWTSHLPAVQRFILVLEDFYAGSFALFRPQVTLLAVLLGMVSWLGEGVGFYLVLIGLGAPAGWASLSTAVFILSFSIVVGAASTLPGGLGAAEASIAGMLTLLLGLPPDLAAAATLLIRFATLWFGVGLGLATWAFSRQLLGLK